MFHWRRSQADSTDPDRLARRVFRQLACRFGKHSALPIYSDWRNSPTGRGFYVSQCRYCANEMVKFHRRPWVKMSSSDVP